MFCSMINMGMQDELVKVCDSREQDIEEFSLQLQSLQNVNEELLATSKQVCVYSCYRECIIVARARLDEGFPGPRLDGEFPRVGLGLGWMIPRDRLDGGFSRGARVDGGLG